MSLYQKIFAHGLALGDDAQHRVYADRKQEMFADLSGTVVEIGPGTGVNIPYLPDGIRWLGLEPNLHMHDFLRKKLGDRDIDAEILERSIQESGLADASADFVISTLVLCSVPDVPAAIAEIRRILKPGGSFLFIEHVAAPPGDWLRVVQSGIRPVWRPLGDGCCPDRDTGKMIEEAGFSSVEYETFRTGLPVVSPHIAGRAVR
ncbi:SAM-dependent methyltransferase [Longibacter salinarum]|uniref:SAM-dependent methyltransferase n=1 Tax=Longibacter salinarum TaxID=1850348 RepID=A0A2A8CTF8_9BACT|nr:class I SAM-dependent methyltransferase [Longibacter salinarum]PEN10359.1 SAM-dependent methyltransferase [Longibacter salinarum]